MTRLLFQSRVHAFLLVVSIALLLSLGANGAAQIPPLEPPVGIGNLETAQLLVVDSKVDVAPGEAALFETQALDQDGLPVEGATVFYQVRGSALSDDYSSVATFVTVTDGDGMSELEYGYEPTSGRPAEVVVLSRDVVTPLALSGVVTPPQSGRTSRLSQDPQMSWVTSTGQVNFGAPAIDACDVPVQCDSLGIPYMECLPGTCSPPNICNINCDAAPDICLLAAVCDLEVPDLLYPIDQEPHQHLNYPRVPNGGSDMVTVFGNACNPKTSFVNGQMQASDGLMWEFTYHKKLGGEKSSVFRDVKYHIRTQGVRKAVKSGIWGYACRTIAGSSKWSTHSWGIAWDISASYEHAGHNTHDCHLVKRATGVPDIWELHGFYWGRGFSTNRDCMHFQYVTGY